MTHFFVITSGLTALISWAHFLGKRYLPTISLNFSKEN